MKKRNILIILLIMVFNSIHAQPIQLNNYEELMNALNKGFNVKAVIHYGDCLMIIDGKEDKAPDAIGGMEFGTYEHFAVGTVRNDKAYVTTSETVLIGHPFYGYVYNYAKIRIFEDNKVEIIARYLDPNTYEVKMDETFRSTINEGGEGGAVFLYSN